MKKFIIFIFLSFILYCQKSKEVNKPKISTDSEIKNLLESNHIIYMPEKVYLQDVNLQDLDKSDHSLLSIIDSLNEKIIVLNLYASWCPYCKKELTSLDLLNSDVDGLSVLGVDTGEDPEVISGFLKANFKLKFKTYVDKPQYLMMIYGLSALPASLIVDKNHKILGVKMGYAEWDKMSGMFDKLVNLYKNQS